MSLVLQQHENRILTQEIIPFLEEHHFRVASLMFDGCLVYKNKSGGVNINNILTTFATQRNLPSYIKLIQKPLEIPNVKHTVEKYIRWSNLLLADTENSHVEFVTDQLKDIVRLTDDEKNFYKYSTQSGLWKKRRQISKSFNRISRCYSGPSLTPCINVLKIKYKNK